VSPFLVASSFFADVGTEKLVERAYSALVFAYVAYILSILLVSLSLRKGVSYDIPLSAALILGIAPESMTIFFFFKLPTTKKKKNCELFDNRI